MNFNAEKPTGPGTFLYKEEDKILTVKVQHYKDLQSGISEFLAVGPTLPRWKNLPVPVWDVSDLPGEWMIFDHRQVDKTPEEPEDDPCVMSNYITPEMVKIPAGKFLMGSPEDEPGRWDNEGPQHEVEIKAFAIGKYEVTFEEYDLFCEATGREKPSDKGWGRGQRPVINVSWYDAVAYAEWLSEQTGKKFRLPTEEEWEYACRAGTTGPRFCQDDELGEYAWCYVNSNGKTHPVGEKKPNPWGIYDMLGNVWEWTSTRYSQYE